MSKDTIYREDAMKVVSHIAMECIDRKTRIELINAIPSADRSEGEWIEMYRNGFGNMICMCSKCNFHATKSNYCPNCGAKMIGADNEISCR